MRVIYDKQTKAIITVVDDDNSITAFPSDYGVLQGDDEMIAKVCEVYSIDTAKLPELSKEVKEVLQDKAFGQSVVDNFIAKLGLADVLEHLYAGDIQAARIALNSKEAESIPVSVKEESVAEMEAYLIANEKPLEPTKSGDQESVEIAVTP